MVDSPSSEHLHDADDQPASKRRRGPRREWPDREGVLLDDLECLFLEEGFSSVTMARLAGHLHVSQATMYRLARSKQALVELVIDRMFQRMARQASNELDGEADHAGRVAAYLGASSMWVLAAGPAFFKDVEADGRTRAIYDRYQAIGTEKLAHLIDDGVRAGQLRPAPAPFLMQVADAGHRRLCEPTALDAVDMTHAQAVSELIGLLLNGITRGGSSTQPPPLEHSSSLSRDD